MANLASSTATPLTRHRSNFIKDAQTRLARHYADQARLAALEAVLADCLHYIEGTYGPEDDLPEPACSIAGKKVLGWAVG